MWQDLYNFCGAHCSVAYGNGSNCECMLHKHMKKGTQLELERVGKFCGYIM